MNTIWFILSLLFNNRAEKLYNEVSRLPDVRSNLVKSAVDAALLAETPDVPAELLLAIAWGETRFEPATITGRAYGPMSTICNGTYNCRSLLNNVNGYRAGAAELESMLKDRRVHGNIRQALLYFACGNSAFDGTCQKKQWPSWVIHRAKGLITPHRRMNAWNVTN